MQLTPSFYGQRI